MPHKRNPSASAIALAAANRLPGLVSTFLAGMVQEHERGLGGWHAEGGTVAASVQATGSALSALAGAIDALRIDPQRMRSNIAATHGAVFAERALVLLAPALGRKRAAEVIASALDGAGAEGRRFPELLAEHPEVRAAIEPAVLAGLEAPESYLGSAEHFRRRLISSVEE
jgi:3-carboxy-cis,cis-muconate cycloisomerase